MIAILNEEGSYYYLQTLGRFYFQGNPEFLRKTKNLLCNYMKGTDDSFEQINLDTYSFRVGAEKKLKNGFINYIAGEIMLSQEYSDLICKKIDKNTETEEILISYNEEKIASLSKEIFDKFWFEKIKKEWVNNIAVFYEERSIGFYKDAEQEFLTA
jgi:hypothetical protein